MTTRSAPLDYCPNCWQPTANVWFLCSCGHQATRAEVVAERARRQREPESELCIRTPYPGAKVLNVR